MESSSDTEHNSESGTPLALDASPRWNHTARAERPHKQLVNPSILPFSSDPNYPPSRPGSRPPLEPEENDTTVEGDMDEDRSVDTGMPPLLRPRPVLRNKDENEDLQVRYFQLQMELKRVRDELARSGQLSNVAAAGDETGVSENIIEEPQQSQVLNELALLKVQNEKLVQQVEGFMESEASLRLQNDSLRSEAAEARSEAEKLRQQLETVGGSAADLDLKFLRTELDMARGELANTRNSESALRAETDQLKAELTHIKNSRIEKRHASELSTAAEELEDLSTRLSRTLKQKSQISAMFEEQLALNEEQNRLLTEAQVQILNLNSNVAELDGRLEARAADVSKLELDLQNSEKESATLKERLNQATEKEKSLTSDLYGLQQEHDSQETALADAKEHHRALEQRIHQQENEKDQVLKEAASLNRELQSKSDQVVKLAAELKEATVKHEEMEKRVQYISASLDQATEDNTKSYQLIDGLRSELHGHEKDLDSQRLENSRLLQQIADFKNKIKELENAFENANGQNASAIEKLESIINRLKHQMEDREESYRAQESDLRSKMALDASHAREKHDEECKRLRMEKSQREYQLVSDISKLEAEIISLKDTRATLEADRDALAVRERKAEQRIKGLDASLRDAIQSLADAEDKARTARSEARDYRTQYEAKKISEEALADKIKALEETISNQAVRLNDINSGDISTLRMHAQEGAVAINEFMRLQEEYANRRSEWIATHNELSLSLQQLSETNKRLEQELLSYRTSDSQREEKFRSAFYTTHQGEIERLRADYQFNYNLLSDSMQSLEAERDNYKRQVLETKANLQEVEFNAKLTLQDINQIRGVAEQRAKELATLREQYTSLEAQNSEVRAQLDELLRKSQDLDCAIQSKESALSELQTQLRESQRKLKAESDEKEDYQRRWYSGQKFYNEILGRMQVIFFAYSYQVESLTFIKRIFNRRFPRIDIIGSSGLMPPKPKRRTFQDAAIFALALVRFRSAAKDGKIRKARESSSYLSTHLPPQ